MANDGTSSLTLVVVAARAWSAHAPAEQLDCDALLFGNSRVVRRGSLATVPVGGGRC